MYEKLRHSESAGLFTGSESANSESRHLTPRTTRRAPAYGVEAEKFGHPHTPTDGGRELSHRAENGHGNRAGLDLARTAEPMPCHPGNNPRHCWPLRARILAAPDNAVQERRNSSRNPPMGGKCDVEWPVSNPTHRQTSSYDFVPIGNPRASRQRRHSVPSGGLSWPQLAHSHRWHRKQAGFSPGFMFLQFGHSQGSDWLSWPWGRGSASPC